MCRGCSEWPCRGCGRCDTGVDRKAGKRSGKSGRSPGTRGKVEVMRTVRRGMEMGGQGGQAQRQVDKKKGQTFTKAAAAGRLHVLCVGGGGRERGVCSKSGS